MSDDPSSENLTLIGKQVTQAALRKCLEEAFPGEPLIRGTEPNWDALTLRAPNGAIDFAALRPAVEKDPFFRLRGAMATVAKLGKGANPNARKKVVDQIEKAELLVRVAGLPKLASVPRGLDVIGNLAQAMNAIVFTGEEFQDSRGRTLLALPGDDDDD